jgi:hypothetical protein
MPGKNSLTQPINVFVWATWCGLLAFALFCIFRYAPNMPLAEDWHMVPALTGNEQDMPGWLWSQVNEHRIPLPRLIYLGLLKLSHGDFRVGMVFNVLLIGLLAAIAIRVCAYLREGKLSLTDAFIPLILLHIGHGNNLFWSWQVSFVLPTVLTLVLLLLIIQYKSALKSSLAIAAGLCLMLLPLCGANGLLYVLPIAPWLLAEGFIQWQHQEQGTKRWVGVLLIGSVLLTGIEGLVYFVGYERPPWNPPSPGLLATLKTGWKFQALGLGPAVEYNWLPALLAIAFLLLPTFILLLATIRRDYTTQSRRVWGMLSFFLGSLLFALAMGYGRAGLVPVYGLPHRYALLAVPALLICYFTWGLYASGVWQKRMQWIFCLTAFILLYPNTKQGFNWLTWYNEGTRAVVLDIEAGMTPSSIAQRNRKFLMHWDKMLLPGYIDMLKQSKIGAFEHIKTESATSRID